MGRKAEGQGPECAEVGGYRAVTHPCQEWSVARSRNRVSLIARIQGLSAFRTGFPPRPSGALWSKRRAPGDRAGRRMQEWQGGAAPRGVGFWHVPLLKVPMLGETSVGETSEESAP